MLNILGYQIDETLYESDNSVVYRAKRITDNQPVILKMLREAYPSPERIAWFKREYEVTRKLNIPGVGTVYNLAYLPVRGTDQQRWVMELEDFGGDSLTHLMNTAPETVNFAKSRLADFLRLASEVANILGQVHQQHIIHKDINPSNIIFNPTTTQVKLINFGISTVLSQENQTFRNPNVLEGTLPYISPEQTGRMNRAMDYRTDFYSLGATFYELLTRQVPFPSDNILEIVHSHIAKQPISPHELVDIPPIVSKIILKLLAKNAEERYQSAHGLKTDLEICLRQLETVGEIISFSLAQQDIPVRFQIPQKLYGREKEVNLVLTAFDRVSSDFGLPILDGNLKAKFEIPKSKILYPRMGENPKSNMELLLVTGYAGVGKSALVQEVYKPITAKRGYFISGKHDQYQQDIPYLALRQALNEFCNHLLTENSEALARWKNKITAAIAENGQILIEVIPNLERVIGAQPEVTKVTSQEGQNRFNLVFQAFIIAISQPSHPLVIFLDDLQWADLASLNLLKSLMSNPEIQNLLIIGSYRDNEVDVGHPLLSAIEEIRKATGLREPQSNGQDRLSTLHLQNLTPSDLNALISDTLASKVDHTQSLADLVYAKTQGNAFFTGEFLKTLYAESLLTFDHSQRLWQWDGAQIEAKNITANVVEFMANKINDLSPATKTILKLAACIGNKFDLETMAMIYRPSGEITDIAPASQILGDLWPAVQEGLVMPLNERYKLIEVIAESDTQSDKVIFRFQHDRVQQAAYSLLSESEKQANHLQIGRLLLANSPNFNFGLGIGDLGLKDDPKSIQNLKSKIEIPENIFDIVNQLNKGVALIDHESEKIRLAQLNLMAGQKAKTSAAHQPALNYFDFGLSLFRDKGINGLADWNLKASFEIPVQNPKSKIKNSLMLSLYSEAAESAYLSGNYEQMDILIESVLQHGQTILDKVKAYETKIEACIAQNKLMDGVHMALPVLKELLGTQFPAKPNLLHVALGLAKTMLTLAIFRYLKRKQVADLADLPAMTDPAKLAAMRILSTTELVAYMASPELFLLLVLKEIDLSLKYGNALSSAVSYGTYGAVMCGALGDIETGYQFGQLALKLSERAHSNKIKVQVYVVLYASIYFWKNHVKETLTPLLEGYQVGLMTGVVGDATYNAFVYGYHALFVGQELAELEQQMSRHNAKMSQLKQETSLRLNQIYWQAVLNLREPTDQPGKLIGRAYDEQIMLPIHVKANDQLTLCSLYVQKLMLSYLFQSYSESIENAALAEKYLEAVMSTLVMPIFHFYDSLAWLALYAESEKAEQKRIIKKVTANQKKIKKLADHAPMNFLHKFYLVEAERARVLDKEGEARVFYDQAIALAQKNEYLNEEALANELAGQFYMAKGQLKFAQICLRDAHYCYQRWGAIAKVKDLEIRYPQLTTLHSSFTATISTKSTTSEILDVDSILKASQTLSSEIVLHRLLEKMMRTVIENAGAQRGLLLLNEEGQWVIEAEGTIDKAEVKIRQSMLLETVPNFQDGESLPISIVNYVAHTQENVVLSNAMKEEQFAKDVYMVAHQPKSILCMPLLHRSKLMGILYLENNLTAGAFTADRLKVLSLLSAQVAVSIQNARLYSNLQSNEKKYRTLFEESKDVIFISSPSGEIIDISPACLSLFGYTREELVMKINAEQLYANANERKRFQTEIESHGLVKDFPAKFRSQDGKLKDCLMTATLRQTDDGRLLGYQGIVRDISAQRRAEQERLLLLSIQRELGIAQEIQESILPSPKPKWLGLSLCCYAMPAREVGGDFYTYHAFSQGVELREQEDSGEVLPVPSGDRSQRSGEVIQNLKSKIQNPNQSRHRSLTPSQTLVLDNLPHRPDKYVVAVGDVSGKGIPAALLMAVSLASLRAIVGQLITPSELLAQMDNALVHYTHMTKQNCALVYLEITPPKEGLQRMEKGTNGIENKTNGMENKTNGVGLLRVANAGCVTPIIKWADGSVEWIEVGGMPLGVGLGAKFGYQEMTLSLLKGDIIILTSDGVVEAKNGNGEMFSFERLEQAVAAGPQTSAEAMLDYLKESVEAFVGETEPHDDITIVVIQV